ncbi:MAG: hypothetical protein V1814_02290 [Candidatus Moraniibacteriota bacterium]
MGELKYRAETVSNGINEAVKVISSQAARIENMLREIKSMAEYAEKVEVENIQLKRDLEDQGKELEKTTKEKDALMKQK